MTTKKRGGGGSRHTPVRLGRRVGQDTDGQHYTLGANGWIPASHTVTEFLKLYNYFVNGVFFSCVTHSTSSG
jgi:hypothetical protein